MHREDLLRPTRLGALPLELLEQIGAVLSVDFYPKGTVIVLEGDASESLFILLSGNVKLFNREASGHGVTLRLVDPGDVFGISCVISHTPYCYSAEALLPSRVGVIEADRFNALAKKRGELFSWALNQMTCELHEAWELVRILAGPSVEARLARLLLSHARPSGESLTMVQEEIADSIGVARETVNRMLSAFRRRGLVRSVGGSIVILDPEGLCGIAGLLDE